LILAVLRKNLSQKKKEKEMGEKSAEYRDVLDSEWF